MGVQEYTEVHRWYRSRLHRESTLRFIPKGCEVPRVLIHLLSRIFRRQWSRLRIWSITMRTLSACECASLLKCSATGESLVLQCAMSNRWLLIVRCSGCPVSPTYCWPHLLHAIRWTSGCLDTICGPPCTLVPPRWHHGYVNIIRPTNFN